MVSKNLEKSPSQLLTYLVHLEKPAEGFFQYGTFLKKRRKVGDFWEWGGLTSGLGQMKIADIKVFLL